MARVVAPSSRAMSASLRWWNDTFRISLGAVATPMATGFISPPQAPGVTDDEPRHEGGGRGAALVDDRRLDDRFAAAGPAPQTAQADLARLRGEVNAAHLAFAGTSLRQRCQVRR